jgi:predicted transcriptional regulator
MLAMSNPDLIDSLYEHQDIVDWINHTLDQNSSNQPVGLNGLEQRVTQLVAALEIACEDTSSRLERVIDDTSRGIPRLAYDLNFMKDGALSLQSTLLKVRDLSSHAVPPETVQALDRLQTLDTMKRHMEAAREVLREAESWSTLELEVTSLLGEQNYAKAAERLSEASKSMVVFQNTPEYESRRTLMVNLQNQLEASLSSALVAAINSQDVAVCRNYFSIFSVIQRESEFRNYYNGSRRASLVAMWQNAILSDCESPSANGTAQTFSEFLSKFYAAFLSLLNSERTCIPSIFPDPQLTLSALITSVLSALQPGFSQRLNLLFNHYGASGLKQTIACYRATEEFAAAVEKVMEKIKYAAVLPSPIDGSNLDNTTAHRHSRRRSNRMSMSLRPGPNRSPGSGPSGFNSLVAGIDWDQDLFQPFVDLQVDYETLERRLLDDALNEIISADRMLESDRARILRERSVDVFSVAEESVGRCISFTHGYGTIGLVHALNGFFRSFIDMWTADISHTRRGGDTKAGPSAASIGDLEDLDYTDEDWANFQLALHLLASARVLYERMGIFEAKLRTNLGHVVMSMRLDLNEASTKSGAQLLAQSTLNSAELHNLLSNLEPEHSFLASSSRQNPSLGQSGPPILLANARTAIFEFSKACQLSLQGTILAPLKKHLSTYASSSMWTTPGDPKTTRFGNDLQVPSFSLSPSDTVQRVAEGLLNLPRLFEVYADDDALAFSLHSLPHVDSELFKGLLETGEGPMVRSHVRRASLSAKPTTLAPETVTAAWLSSLGQSILTHLMANVLPGIRTLSVAGAAQLASDLGYLSNIVRALNVECEELERWKEYVGLDDDEGRRKVEENSGDAVLRKVARMRGWTL